jgi:hypothetical protein
MSLIQQENRAKRWQARGLFSENPPKNLTPITEFYRGKNFRNPPIFRGGNRGFYRAGSSETGCFASLHSMDRSIDPGGSGAGGGGGPACVSRTTRCEL